MYVECQVEYPFRALLLFQSEREVMKQTASKQVPWEASSLVGTFYFSGGANSTASNSGTNNAAPGETRFDAAAFEYSYWETIKNSNSADDFKAYLAKYPEGQFVALAKNRISSIDASTKTAESKPAASDSATELAFWDSIKNSNRIEDLQAYLKKYPNGTFTELANNRMAALETERGKTEAIKKSSLEGTTWRGDSPGGDKHYEFKFLPNGEATWHWMKSMDHRTFKGTWRQTGNRIDMDFTGDLIEATINGDKMTGSLGNGKYKFTVEKVP